MKSPVSHMNVIVVAARVIAIGGLPPSARTVSRRCQTVGRLRGEDRDAVDGGFHGPRSIHEHMFARTSVNQAAATSPGRRPPMSLALRDERRCRLAGRAPDSVTARQATAKPGGGVLAAPAPGGCTAGARSARTRRRRRSAGRRRGAGRSGRRSRRARCCAARRARPRARGRRAGARSARPGAARAARRRSASRRARAAARWRSRIGVGAGEQLDRHQLLEHRAGDVERGAGGGEALHERRVRAHPADPQAGPEGLAHRADRDHGLAGRVERGDRQRAASPPSRCRPAIASSITSGVRVARASATSRSRSAGGHREPGRVLVVGDQVGEPRARPGAASPRASRGPSRPASIGTGTGRAPPARTASSAAA